jgi:hypothetical protein
MGVIYVSTIVREREREGGRGREGGKEKEGGRGGREGREGGRRVGR